MGSLLDKIYQSAGSEPSSVDKQNKQNEEFQRYSKKSDQVLNQASNESLTAGLENLANKALLAGSKAVPTFNDDQKLFKELFQKRLEEDINYGELANQANIAMNPFTGNVQNFAVEAVPYALGGGFYKRGIDAAMPKFSDTFLGRSLATARGSAPVTAGVDIAQNRMPTDGSGEFWTNQLFDLGLSPVGGFAMKGKTKPSENKSPEPAKNDMIFTEEELASQGLDPNDFPDSNSKIEPNTKRVKLTTKDNIDVIDAVEDGTFTKLNDILDNPLPALDDVHVTLDKDASMSQPYDVWKDGKNIHITYKDKLTPQQRSEINQAVLQHETQHITRPGTSPEQIKAASENYDIKQVEEYGKKFDEELAPIMKEYGNTADDIAMAREDIINEAIYRNQKGEMLARENERIETGNQPLANKDVDPYVAHLSNIMREKNPTGEVIFGKPKETAEPIRMNQKVTPKTSVNAETLDLVNKNNLDSAVLREDIKNIIRDLGIKDKPKLLSEIEKALSGSTEKVFKLPKTKEGRAIYSELMKIDKYRLQEQFIMPKKLADKLNNGKTLNASDRRYLKKNEKYLSESDRKSLEAHEDIEKLMSGSTPFDDVIEIMNKYESDSVEFPAMTKEIIQEYKNNPKWFRKMRAEVVSTIKNDLRNNRLKEDNPSVSKKNTDEDNRPDVKENEVLEKAESDAINKAKREKRKRSKDTSSMNAEEKAMHEKGQKDYIFKNKGKETKAQKLEKEKIRIEQEMNQEPYRNDSKREGSYDNLSPADKRWMEKYDEDAKKHKAFTKATQAKRARLLEEMKNPKKKKNNKRAEELKAMSDDNIPIGKDEDEWAKERENKWKGKDKDSDKYESYTDDDIAEFERMHDEDGFIIFENSEKDKWIEQKRSNSKKKFDSSRKQMKGELGKDSTEFVDGVKNPAKEFDQESADMFTSPEAMHTEFNEGNGHTGYEGGQQTYIKTLIDGATAFETYIHESFHRILDIDPEQIIKSFEKNYDGSDLPHYDKANMEKNYFDKNPLVQFEENIVFAASDLALSRMPKEVLERFGIDLKQHNRRLRKNLNNLTPEMREIVDDLANKAEKAMNSKGNYLNEFAYGNKKRVMDTLDKYGEHAIEKVINSLLPMIKQIDSKAMDFKSYRKARDYADELIQNVVSQANKLPVQKFIDKYTSIARATEEKGKNFANKTAGEIKETFKDLKTREKLTEVVMKKDIQSIADEYHAADSYDDFLRTRKQNEKEIRLFLTNDTKKMIKQLIASFTDPKAMNSPHWKHNAFEILSQNKYFNDMVKEYHKTGNKDLRAKIDSTIVAMDKHISMSAVSLNDFNFMKGLDQTALGKVIDMHKEAVSNSKSSMVNPSTTYIKGYKPSLFRNYIEFTDKPDFIYTTKDEHGRKNRDGTKVRRLNGWKRYKNTNLYYRDAIKPDAASGMMTQREHKAKGAIQDIDTKDIPDIVKYAEEHGYGIVSADGEIKLRKVVSQDIRRDIMDENMDIAENMASLIENNIHDKVTGKHDAEMLQEFDKHGLIVDELRATNEYEIMTTKELSLLPDRIRISLIDTYGIDKIWISKKYKEQIIGYSNDMSALKHLEKSGLQITHKMLMNEAKLLDTVTETTQLIKQTLILKNPVVITGNYMFQGIVAMLEGVPLKDIAKYQKEALSDFTEYTKLTSRRISLEINGKKNTEAYKKTMQELESNVAYRLFMENKDGGGIDRNLLLKSLRESNLSRKHMEKKMTEILGGEDTLQYKTAKELFITPESYVGSFLVKSLNYVDYMGRSTLMRHYLKQGKSFEDAARLANSKTVSFSKQLPSSTAWIERYGMDHFLTWTLRNSVGLTVSMKEHPARWLAFIVAYQALTEESGQYDSRYLGNVRVSSFNPAESILTGMLDSGIYGHIAHEGVMAMEPELIRKIREGDNPALTTK